MAKSQISRGLLALALCVAGAAHAQAVPATVTFTARLGDNGIPAQGSKQFLFKIFPTLGGGTEVWSETQTLTVTDGDVSAELGASTPLSDTIFAGPKLFLEVTVDGTLLTPRSAVVSVPYSLRTGVAGKVGTLAEADIQRRVIAAGCAVGSSIRMINPDGTVSCQSANVVMGADGGTAISGVFGGAGLAGGGSSGDITLTASFGGSGTATTVSHSDHNHTGTYLPLGSPLACTGTDKVTGLGSNGSVICSADLGGSSYTAVANGGLVLASGTQFGLTTCAVGELLKSTGVGTWSCQADATGGSGAVTNVSATAPLTSSGGGTPVISLTGTVGVANGGTGAANPASARAGLGAAASGANSDITQLNGLSTALSLAQGGTGGSTAVAARNGLGAAASGANSDITALNALTTALTLAQGGTGATTAVAALSSLGAAASGANWDITALNALTTALTTAQGGTGLTASGGAGSYLRSNGSAWVTSAIQAGDIPSGSSNYIQNQSTASQAGKLWISGVVRSDGPHRIGSETGTSEAPKVDAYAGGYNGIVARRINSTTIGIGSIVARTDMLTFERNGTIYGFQLTKVGTTNHRQMLMCQGVSSTGLSTNKVIDVPAGAASGTVYTVYTNADDVAMMTCVFGGMDASINEVGNHTTLTMARTNTGTIFLGTLTSTFNQ